MALKPREFGSIWKWYLEKTQDIKSQQRDKKEIEKVN